MSRPPHTALVLLLGWFVPGAGHFVLGRRTQAAFFFLVITAGYVGGMALADFTNVSPERHLYYFIAHALNGAETMAATLLTRDLLPTRVPVHLGVATAEIGMLYTTIAALLNVLVLTNAWDIAMKRREAPAPEVAA